MRIKTAILAIALGMLAFLAEIAAAAGVVEIYPTGSFPEDVMAIQAAVDSFAAAGKGGVIILKARNMDGVPTPFNFKNDGEPEERGTVLIAGDPVGRIEFVGEIEDDAQTAIVGGNIPIHMVRKDRL